MIQIRQRSERAKLEALHLHSWFPSREGGSGGNAYVQKDTYISLAFVKHSVSWYVKYSFRED